MIPAFRLLKSKCPNAYLAIVGPDNEGYGANVRQWCVEQGIRERVFFVDYLDSKRVKEAYVDADIFVLPSYTENFGLTVVESMACGTPVVISDQVNIWREVKQDRSGLVVSLDSNAISEALYRFLINPNEADNFGARGRVAAKSRYAWPRIVKKLSLVYQELIEEKSRDNSHGQRKP